MAIELSELSTNILVLKVLIAAAWADGEMHESERKLLQQIIEKSRMSESRKATLTLDIERKPEVSDVDAILEELCIRSKTNEMKQAIFALTDKMLGADSKLDESEIAFREKLECTLNEKGSRFFALIKDYIGKK